MCIVIYAKNFNILYLTKTLQISGFIKFDEYHAYLLAHINVSTIAMSEIKEYMQICKCFPL